jgi:acyl-CoA thioester hydrolase
MIQDGVGATELRVRYAETDQMGIAHHANYLIWCELARTDFMRDLGVRYRELEEGGLLLPVVDVRLRYRAVARYDDLLRVRCWVREVATRRVIFGYAVDRRTDGQLLATAQTSLMALGSKHERTTIPDLVRQALVVVPDPVRL